GVDPRALSSIQTQLIGPHMLRLHTDPDAYFSQGRSCNEVFSRKATRSLLLILASRGYHALGVDGGIYSNGTFEPRIDAAQSWPNAASRQQAHTLHLKAIRSMDDDPIEYNGYAVTTAPIG